MFDSCANIASIRRVICAGVRPRIVWFWEALASGVTAWRSSGVITRVPRPFICSKNVRLRTERMITHAYEGTTTPLEEMHLEYQRLLQQYPGLPERLAALPGRLFSGKAHPSPGARAVFFCYSLPTPPPVTAGVPGRPGSMDHGGRNYSLVSV